MSVAAVAALRPLAPSRLRSITLAAPPHLPGVGEVNSFRPVPDVTPIRPADRVAVYQLRPDGRLDFLTLRAARRAFQPAIARPTLGARLDLYA